jgi:DNA-directed RNA polymerase specialized sigma24 family protein
MADRSRYPPPHGDEADLFRAYNDELMRTVSGVVRSSSPEVIEDACAYAWAKFLQCQPGRDKNWRGWLFRTAQRQAWELERGQREHYSPGDDPERQEYVFAQARISRPDPYETQLEVTDAFEILDRLPERLPRVALRHALGLRHTDIGRLTGDTPTRVGQLISRANQHIYELLEERARQCPDAPPRARRLADLEQRPPRWLVERIGRPPRAVARNVALSGTRRAWRRAALALDDLRQAAGPDFDTSRRAAEPRFAELQARAVAAVGELDQERARERARRTRRNLGR